MNVDRPRTLHADDSRQPAWTAGRASPAPAGALPRARRQPGRGVVLSEDTGLNVNVRMGEVETVERTRDRGIAVTVYFGQRKGSASTADLQRGQPGRHRRAGLRDRAPHRGRRRRRPGRCRADGDATCATSTAGIPGRSTPTARSTWRWPAKRAGRELDPRIEQLRRRLGRQRREPVGLRQLAWLHRPRAQHQPLASAAR